jgi:hypothetical protein
MKRLGALALLLGTLGCNTLYVDYPSPDPALWT